MSCLHFEQTEVALPFLSIHPKGIATFIRTKTGEILQIVDNYDGPCSTKNYTQNNLRSQLKKVTYMGFGVQELELELKHEN